MAFKNKVDEKILDVDVAMQGNMVFKDAVNLRINGRFEGDLQTKGNLTIASSATVIANIVGDNIIIDGKFKGRIVAKEMLTLLPSAVLEGDIFPAKLNVAEGAIFEGKCSMLHDFMSADELAHYLEVDLNSILEWASAGKMPGLKEGNSWKFERKAIDSWVTTEKVGR